MKGLNRIPVAIIRNDLPAACSSLFVFGSKILKLGVGKTHSIVYFIFMEDYVGINRINVKLCIPQIIFTRL